MYLELHNWRVQSSGERWFAGEIFSTSKTAILKRGSGTEALSLDESVGEHRRSGDRGCEEHDIAISTSTAGVDFGVSEEDARDCRNGTGT